MVKDDIILEEESVSMEQDDGGLTLDDFGPGNFVKNPAKDETIIFTVLKVSNNLNTKAINKKTGKEFDVGVKKKDGSVRRIDIDTDLGVYTINTWEIFFKTLGASKGKEGALIKYAKAHNNHFAGAKVSIKKLEEGVHAGYKVEDLAKIIGKSIDETIKYQDAVKQAVKEQRLFEVKLLEA